jgi:hypothetical protein
MLGFASPAKADPCYWSGTQRVVGDYQPNFDTHRQVIVTYQTGRSCVGEPLQVKVMSVEEWLQVQNFDNVEHKLASVFVQESNSWSVWNWQTDGAWDTHCWSACTIDKLFNPNAVMNYNSIHNGIYTYLQNGLYGGGDLVDCFNFLDDSINTPHIQQGPCY